MTDLEQNRALRKSILSLQTGLLAILDFLDILAAQSTDPGQFRRQIQAIRDSIQLLDELPPPLPLEEIENDPRDRDAPE